MREASPAAEIARSPEAWERLAKDWIVEVIERTPLASVEELPLAWMSQEAPPLIAEILGQLSDPGPAGDLRLPPATLERAASLAAAQAPASAAVSLPRELAALQALMVEALDRELPRPERREFARAVARLAEVFGAISAVAIEALGPASGSERAPLPGLAAAAPPPATAPEPRARLFDAMALLARDRMPFALAWVDIEGMERISKGYSADAADRMAEAVTGIVESQLSGPWTSHRIEAGALAILAPNEEAVALSHVAIEIAEVVARSQADSGPRVAVSVGVAAHPANGTDLDELLETAEQAAWAARAAGDQVNVAAVRVPGS